MPFTLKLSLLDLAGYYSGGIPALSGAIFAPPVSSASGATPLDSAVSTLAAPLSFAFASSAVPPASTSALIVTEPATGDVVRSGAVTSLPVSPVTVITIPPVAVPASTLIAAAAGFAIPPTAVPLGVQIASGVVTGGTFIPLVVIMPPIIPTLGTGTISATGIGVLTARVFYFGLATYVFTLSVTMAPAPSGDPSDRLRVVRVSPTASSLTGVGPAGFVLAPALAVIAALGLEKLFNSMIASTAATSAAAMGMSLTSSAVLSARRVVVTPSGMSLQLILSDLFGPGVVAIPKTLAVAISPAPVAGVQTSYTVTVTDAASAAPVPNAAVTLHNFATTGAANTQSATTDAAGRAVFNVKLQVKKTQSVVTTTDTDSRGKPVKDRERVEIDISPTLQVQAPGFTPVTIKLL